MKRLMSVFAVLGVLAISPLIADEKIGEAELSGAYLDSQAGGEVASLTGGVYAPIFNRFLLGPAGRFSYLNRPGSDSTTGSAAGAVLEFHLTGNTTGIIPFVRAEGFKWFGDLENVLDYQYSAGGGFKVGDDATAFKFTVVRTWIEGTDLQQTEARLGFVWRL